MKMKKMEMYFASASIVLGVFFLIYMIPNQIRTRASARADVEMFPVFASWILIAAGLSLLIMRIVSMARSKEKFQLDADWKKCLLPLAKQAGFLAGFIVLVLIMRVTGFVIPAALFLFGALYLFGSVNLPKNAVISVIFSIAAYFLFTEIFKVNLPQGWLPF